MMEGFEHFHFLRPWLLLLVIPLFVLLYKLKQAAGSLVSWQKVCDPVLFEYLKVGVDTKVSQSSFIGMGLVILLVVTALAGPVWKQLPQPMFSQQSAVVVLLDLSKSMDAEDIKPSRLIRAKQKLTDLLKLRKEGQTALVVFAGSAFVVTPLSDDQETVLAQLQSLTTDIMPQQGGDIDAGMLKALALFKQAQVQHGVVITLTDSERFSSSVVNELVQAGHSLNVIGVGTTSGAPITKAAGGFVTDRSGNIVITQLDESRLRDLASLGQGFYRKLTLDDSDLRIVLSSTNQDMWQDQNKATSQTSDQWFEEGPWLLLLVLPLVLMGFRRGVLVVMLCAFVQTPDAHAGIWSDLWLTKQQQGEQFIAEQKYEQAAQTFDHPAWQAAAAYKQGDYETARQTLENIKQPNSEDMYNQGNSLAQLGELDKAIAAYDKVLKQNPNHQDALANKVLLEKLKQQQQDKKDQNQDDQNEEGEQSKQDSEKSKQQQGQQKPPEQQQNQDGDPQDSGQSQDSKQAKDKAQPESKIDQEQDDKKEPESEAEKQEKQQSKQQVAQQDDKQKADKKAKQSPSPDDMEKTEAQQAFEQTLRRVPDDPGGLLRRKFLYQYQQREKHNTSGEEQW